MGKVSKLYKLYCENANPKLSITFDDYVEIIPSTFIKEYGLKSDDINYNTIKLPTVIDDANSEEII